MIIFCYLEYYDDQLHNYYSVTILPREYFVIVKLYHRIKKTFDCIIQNIYKNYLQNIIVHYSCIFVIKH